MSENKKIILIGNYVPDRQESMERFTQMLKSGFESAGIDVAIWYPTVFFGKLSKSTLSGFGKWLGYLDKWLVFSLVLRLKKSNDANVRYHICDHSNAAYVPHLPKGRTSITCHDVLAIRGALGFKDAYCPASSTGTILQKWILKNLLSADKIAAVSQFTLNQLIALNKGIAKPGWTVIHNGFNAGFKKLDSTEWQGVLQDNSQESLINNPYIVHVGSNLQRKNRKMLLNMVASLGEKWNGLICFTGQPMNAELMQQASQLGLAGRIVEIKKPSHLYLEALINGAQAFVFPSFSEGFGWPVIEAQACGTPVIASSLEPMPEVGSNGAIYADPYNASAFAEALLSVNRNEGISELLQNGFENTKRFNTDLMNKKYLELIF